MTAWRSLWRTWGALFVVLLFVFWFAAPAVAQSPSTQCIANVAAQGTSDAITSAQLPCGTTTNLVLLTAVAANTTETPTYAPQGQPPLPVLKGNGVPLAIGDIAGPGYVALLTSTGSAWILLNPLNAVVPNLVNGAFVPKPLTFAGTAYVDGNPNPIYQGLAVQHSSVGGTDAADSFLVPYNSIFVDQDSAALTGGQNSIGSAFTVYDNFGGSALKGSRSGLYVNTVQTATTGNTVSGFANQYTAGAFDITGTANDNGTAPTNLGSLGAFTAINPICQLLSGATDIFTCQVVEADIAVAAGASVYKKTALEIVKLANDAVQGVVDGAIIMDDYPGVPGWKYGVAFGSNQTGTQFPFTTASTLIGCAGNCGTVGYGVDLLNVTVTTDAFRSLGFAVSGVGQVGINTGTLSGSSSMLFVGGNDGGSEGGQIQLANTFAGATTPNKFLRVAASGNFQILNSAYGASIFDLTDGGGLKVATLSLGAIPTSAGTGGLYVCADSTGTTYKKSSCP